MTASKSYLQTHGRHNQSQSANKSSSLRTGKHVQRTRSLEARKGRDVRSDFERAVRSDFERAAQIFGLSHLPLQQPWCRYAANQKNQSRQRLAKQTISQNRHANPQFTQSVNR